MIHVIAVITLKPGSREQFLREFHALMPSVHAEDGCIEYGPTVDAETPIAAQIPRRPDVVTNVLPGDAWEVPTFAYVENPGAPNEAILTNTVAQLTLR